MIKSVNKDIVLPGYKCHFIRNPVNRPIIQLLDLVCNSPTHTLFLFTAEEKKEEKKEESEEESDDDMGFGLFD